MPYKNKDDRNAYERQRRADGRDSYQHDWYELNKERIKRTAKLRYQSKRTFVDSFKMFPCMDCGHSYPSYVMDFDHRDPSQKCFDVSRGLNGEGKNRERLLEEIAKCEVVCSNCHRERTHGIG